MQAWGLTDPGMVREQNQDTFVIRQLDDNTVLAVVCDGMGGARCGSEASALALEEFVLCVSAGWWANMPPEDVERIFGEAVAQAANGAVYRKGKSGEEFAGMGTTLVAVLADENAAHFVNVGDSRAYHVGKTGIRLVTTDHSYVQLMVQRGELTPEEAKSHPKKNVITRAVGTEEQVCGDVYHVDLEEGDAVTLCSDGLSNTMADQEILFEIVHGEDRADCCQRLLQIAKNRGAPDNVTVVLLSR